MVVAKIQRPGIRKKIQKDSYGRYIRKYRTIILVKGIFGYSAFYTVKGANLVIYNQRSYMTILLH